SLEHAKSSTTPQDLTIGIQNCLRKSGVDLKSCKSFVHGTTTAINTVIEEKGAKTALITTKGTRDVYRIGRGSRPEAYNIFFKRPVPLVSRRLTLEAEERMFASGEVLTPLTEENAAAIAEEIARFSPEAIAVCFLHSYINPEHEKIMGEALKKALPSTYVSLSHEILREYREYERTATTVVNSYIGPIVKRYIEDLETQIKDMGFPGELLIMQSNGGVMSPGLAQKAPVAMMESGPVGGIIASAEIGKRLGFMDVIAFDMGGTTAKASLIKDGEPSVAEGYHVGGYASGHPIMLPVIDVVEVGAGGGSIAWIDEVGGLKIGPQSAGGHPGPVCYDEGGEDPTVTDANVVLGRINSENFLGGEMPLNLEKARKAIKEKIASKLNFSVEEAAMGIVQIAVAKMSLAVRGVSVEKGYDPRDFVLVASGGAGPVHALAIARELKIPKVIIPPLPAHFSAMGMLMTDIKHDFIRTYYKPLKDADFDKIKKIYDEMVTDGITTIEKEGVETDAIRTPAFFDLRYIGQEFFLTIPVSEEAIYSGDREAIRANFDSLHQMRYGHKAGDEALEIVNIRLTALGVRQKVAISENQTSEKGQAVKGHRDIFVDDSGKSVKCPIYERKSLTVSDKVDGPAIIEEYASTTFLSQGDEARLSEFNDIIITLGDVK
ncbi:MAG: hydantoinase/oxoprolinase family protein, partial [Desulfobacterales bacterium]|nr:hydantoinase/oxoprolinase family protein [Desulfobacterales bacterium]